LLRPAFALLVFLFTFGAEAAEPKRVLLLHSYGRDFAPWNDYARKMRAELDRLGGQSLDIYEATLASARFTDEDAESAFAEYLRTLFTKRKADLVVTIGAPAANFFQKNRQRMFATIPLLLTAVEQRRVELGGLTDNDTAVAITIDIAAVFQNILKVLPDTNNIVVVMGNSPNEIYWSEQIKIAARPYVDRVNFTWYNSLSFNEMLRRVAVLPPNSAIFYGLLSVDAAGVPHEGAQTLDRLHAVATAPIFSYVDAYFGQGIVGGPLINVSDVSRRSADVALRILQGEAPSSIRMSPIGLGTPKFDWREMQRWGLSTQALPASSIVEFRVPTVFEQYRNHILLAVAIVLIEAAFIVALLLNRRRLEREKLERRRAEEMARDFSGRLISAQEDERSRLARELHDDITQRLALLAIDAGRAQPQDNEDGGGRVRVRDGLIRLSEDVHALSYRLHPSILDDLGLHEALRAECARFSEAEPVSMSVSLQPGPDAPSKEAALCLFRITQEALRNISRHSRAKTAAVALRARDGGLELCVRDDGIGFDPEQHGGRSLGLASMKQRIYLLGGEILIDSTPGQGTTVLAWLSSGEKRIASPNRIAG